jgi:hypothetical protein
MRNYSIKYNVTTYNKINIKLGDISNPIIINPEQLNKTNSKKSPPILMIILFVSLFSVSFPFIFYTFQKYCLSRNDKIGLDINNDNNINKTIRNTIQIDSIIGNTFVDNTSVSNIIVYNSDEKDFNGINPLKQSDDLNTKLIIVRDVEMAI